MPSAMPSRMSYYQEKSGYFRGDGWDDLESRGSIMSPGRVYVPVDTPGMVMKSSLEKVGDEEVHGIGEDVV